MPLSAGIELISSETLNRVWRYFFFETRLGGVVYSCFFLVVSNLPTLQMSCKSNIFYLIGLFQQRELFFIQASPLVANVQLDQNRSLDVIRSATKTPRHQD